LKPFEKKKKKKKEQRAGKKLMKDVDYHAAPRHPLTVKI
jgi:hypothetical protein